MYYKFIFDTRPMTDHSAFSRWKINTKGEGSAIEASYSLKGFCMGITLTWIKESAFSSGLLTSSSDLGSVHLIGIRSSQFNSHAMQEMSYWARWRYTFSIYGLSVGETRVTFFRPNNINLKMEVQRMLKKKGYFLLILSKDGTDKHHCFGLRADDHAFEFFDANHGLFRFRNGLELLDFFLVYMKNYDKYIPGSIRVIETIKE